jgi:pilus assembly protein FimV
MEPAPTPTPPAVPEKAPVKAVRPPVTEAPGKSWADTLKAFWFVPILLLAGLGGLVAYRKYQAKQSAAFDETLGRLASEDTQDRLRALDSDDTTRLRKPTGTAGDSFVVEESGAHQRPAALAPVAAAPPPVKTEDTISSESAINLDQSDPLAEADFHMAYGLYDQASDLVRMAIAREPDRRDLKLKLLEVFFVWGNRDQFLATAHELAATRANAAPGEWDKIVIMGKQIAADDSLFSQSGGYSAAGASGVDLDLEGGQNRVDFDVAAEPAGAGGDGGMMAGRKESTAEHTASSSSAVDFLLDDPGRGGDLGGDAARDSTAEMPIDADSPLGAVWAAADGSDAPTVEQPAIRGGDSPTIRQKVEHALRQSPKADQTAEVALDDLGLDLGADEAEHADLGEEEPSSDVPTMVAGFDARSKRLIDEAERRVSVTPAATMSGTWLVEDEPAGSVDTGVTAEMPRSVDTGVTAELPRTVGAGGHTGDTSQIAALKVDDLDLDLGGAEPAAGARSDATAVQTRRISTEEMALPDLEPVTMSEVGTKLDLARAYMDMGDPDGARSILQEVLAEGSVSQKQEAQRLMQTLPG